MIVKMNEKNSNSTIKDEKIMTLEKKIHNIRQDQCKQENDKESLRKKVKEQKLTIAELEEDREFYKK